jgi:chromosome partitioning protein
MAQNALVQIPRTQLKEPKVITFANQKGGCAKTTSVVSVAEALTLLGYRVLVVDMDSQANVSAGLGVKRLAYKERKVLSEVMRKNLKLNEVRMPTKNPKLDIVAADIAVNRAMLELIGRPRQHYILTHLLDCPERFDYDSS